MVDEIPSYKTRLKRFCDKVQSVVEELQNEEQAVTMEPANSAAKKHLTDVMQEMLDEVDEMDKVHR